MDMQNVTKLNIPEGEVRTIHDKNGDLLWGKVSYGVKYKGDTAQNGTPTPSAPVPVQTVTGENVVKITGKNLFNLATPATNNGVTVTANADGSFTLNGTTTGVAVFNFILPVLKPAGTYTISCTSKNQVMPNSFYIRARNQNMTMLVPGGADGPSQIRGGGTNYAEKTFTSTDPMYCLALNLTTTGVTYNNMIIYPQVEVGSAATAYEPYQGQSYEINLGKNLYDKSSSTDGKRLDANGGEYTDSAFTLSAYIPVEPNTKYTLSGMPGSSYGHVATYDSSKTFVGRRYVGSDPFTFTTLANARYIRIATPLVCKDSTQCELGSQATSYAAYFTPIELCKIGDYQDYIYKSGGKWYVHKAVGKYVYNNDLTSNGISSIRVDMLTPVLPIAPNIASLVGVAVSNMYGSQISNNSGLSGSTAVSCIRVNTSISIADSYDAVKALAAANNLTIYYALATPTDTEITNQALIAQLEAVNQWMTRYGYNASVTGNLPIIIDKTQL